jgi:hypothetical protein
MKKEQRIPYLILAAFQDEIKIEMCTSLCAFAGMSHLKVAALAAIIIPSVNIQ